ncbi:MAG: hypothetical protein AAF184_12695 [Pseudomonadota bacterium]
MRYSLIAAARGVVLVIALALALPTTSGAMTVADFQGICERVEGSCENSPLLNAYIGGSLDMIATLDERTDFLGEVYCRPTKELFDVAAIIRYAQRAARAAEPKANAMTLVVAYLVEEGGC